MTSVDEQSRRERAKPTELPEIFECDDCHLRVPLHARSLDAHQQLGECALCGTNEFFIQKDFNRRLGLFVVIISALVAFLVMGSRLIIQGVL